MAIVEFEIEAGENNQEEIQFFGSPMFGPAMRR